MNQELSIQTYCKEFTLVILYIFGPLIEPTHPGMFTVYCSRVCAKYHAPYTMQTILK